ncbi:unnamed protein product [Leptidea sinapis]|uniref:Uncharacterized protein n=1 Tax=Leptidea sinapis TaxID=189913 RepID=A0A5E4QWC8_9NEOP|nr:unnamed protein product [Leptidea sinapis]
MNSYIKIALVLCGCVMLTSAQYNFGYYGSSFGGADFNTLSGSARDPRANTGPVVFPPSPPGDPSITSGVVPGASGYGFQPPGFQGYVVPRYFYSRFFGAR